MSNLCHVHGPASRVQQLMIKPGSTLQLAAFDKLPGIELQQGEKCTEVLFESAVIPAQILTGPGHFRLKGAALRQPLQSPVDAFNAAVMHQPVAGVHALKALIGSCWEMGLELRQAAVGAAGEFLERHAAIVVPVMGKKVVVENIDYDGGIMPMSAPQTPFAPDHQRMAIGKGVNTAMMEDASVDIAGEIRRTFTAKKICDKAARQQRF